jgi:ornithine cyclodeaminase/alanine dehydrogenase-like protein (mu-crystallin family)
MLLPVAMILSSTRWGMTKDGIPLCTSDLMTASISALGTRRMSRSDSVKLALLGSGKQARNHLIAMNSIRSLSRVNVYSPTRERREQFAAEMSALLNLKIVPIGSAQQALSGADIVLAATNTNVLVLSGDWLREGTHVTSIVGSDVGMAMLTSRSSRTMAGREVTWGEGY